MSAAPDFSPASTLPRNSVHPPSLDATTAQSNDTERPSAQGQSHRNASNAHLPPQADAQGSNAEAGPSRTVNKPVNVPTGNKRSIIVNACQRGNPILNAIKGIGWEYGDIVPDYQVGPNTCVLFLSLKYHRLHPEYLHNRIERLRGMYLLRVLLLICDISEHQEPIREITKICLINEMTVMVAWNVQEAANYIMTYKAFENKSPDMLKERVQNDYPSQLQSVLTSVKGVNKTDVITLSTNFGSFKKLTHATSEQLSLCPGLGDVKVRRLMEAFNLPFRPGAGTAGKQKKGSGSGFVSSKKAKTKVSTPNGKSTREETPSTTPSGQLKLTELVQNGQSKRKRTDNGKIIDVDEEEGFEEIPPGEQPDPKKQKTTAPVGSPEWEASDKEEGSIPRPDREPSPDWDSSDNEAPLGQLSALES